MIQCIMAQVVQLMTNGLVSAKLITATITAEDLNIIPHTHKDLFCKSYFTESTDPEMFIHFHFLAFFISPSYVTPNTEREDY